MQFWDDVAVNLAANLIFWGALGLAALCLVGVSQRRFRRFFGLESKKMLVACLSNRWSESVSSRPRGYLVALHELRASDSISRLFGSPSLRLPEAVRGLVDSVFLGSRRYEYRISVSPAPMDDVRAFRELGNNLVVVGGSGVNRIRRLYVDENRVRICLASEKVEVGPDDPRGSPLLVLLGPESGRQVVHESLHLAILEKAYDDTRKATVFFCLGRRGDVSWATVEYLVKNWQALDKEFKGQPFALGLGFVDPAYSYDYSEPIRLVTL